MSMFIRITIHECKDLIAADLNGYSDPYVVIAGSGQNFKTTIKDKNLNPVWNEGFELEFPLGMKPNVTLTVWDKDLITDDFLGMVFVDISDLPLDGTSIWKDLQPRPGKKDKIKGQIRISFVPGAKTSNSGSNTKSNIGPVSNQVAGRLKAANDEDATELDLTGCNLSEIPEGVLAVKEWTSLDLGFNMFSVWPDSLSNFKFLAELFFSGNQLTVLPPTIADLGGSLRSLYLNGNFLKELPEQISALTNLEKLDVANNQIKVLPPEIGAVAQLEELRMSGNPLTTLPVELGNLQYLITLDLNGCNLRSIPEKTFRMPRLLELDLGTNVLTSLPSDMGNLTRLVTLNLSDNKLTDLPVSMGKCESMDSCLLDRNPITNEALMKKYKIGTDHLIDYLSKRLFEQEQVAKIKLKAGIDTNRAKIDRPPLDDGRPVAAPSGRPKLSEIMAQEDDDDDGPINWVTPGGARFADDFDDYEETEEEKEARAWAKLEPEQRTIKKRYAAQATCHQIRQQLVDVKKGVMLSKTTEECIPWAKIIRDLKKLIDGIEEHLPRYEKPQPAPLFAHETKFQQLKKTTMVALKEVEAANNAVLNTCSTLITEDRVDSLRKFLKDVQNRITEEMGSPMSPR